MTRRQLPDVFRRRMTEVIFCVRGVIGALFGDLSIYNSQFSSNQATGNGANKISSACPVKGGQSGNGGNGGAVVIDGAEAHTVTVCGSTFTSNAGGARGPGGAVFCQP